ncbi:hypothetical protein LPJ56_006649 [Coemansia sp. RSA 2599]|nr:hypothetical protein LPJ75_006696 [Coemansia sp. RSA 2598]KAJ1804808.1 hypothetical protein LPJ56_006649 [Coemansia sp. RSA 2599]
MPDSLSWGLVTVIRDLGTTKNNCGGTIISSKHIITAAHCVVLEEDKAFPVANITIGHNNKDEEKQDVAKVSSIVLHPDYFTRKRDGKVDIAILELQSELTLGGATNRLPIYDGLINDGQTMLSTGWGQTEENAPDQSILRGAFVIAGNKTLCQPIMNDFEDNNGPQICAPGALTPYTGSCMGDSGTSLIISSQGKLMHTGIVSITVNTNQTECANPTGAHYYVRSAFYMDFIVQTTSLTKEYLTSFT